MHTATEVRFQICTELLVPFFRVARCPLGPWTQSLHDRLTGASARPAHEWFAACDQIASCFNESALIEVHFGRSEHALALCHREIVWAHEVSRRPGRLAAVQFAFQPHINIGRLDRNEGRWDEALTRFQLLRTFYTQGAIELGGQTVARRHADAIRASNAEFVDQMVANYIVDTLSTLLRAERFADASAFVEAAEPARYEWANDLVYEAGIIALSCQGNLARAQERVTAYLQRPQRPHGSVFLYRRAELLLANGDHAGAARIANGLAVALMNALIPLDRINLRLMARLARLLGQLGELRAVDLARAGMRRAHDVDDVLLQQEFLKLLAVLAPTVDECAAARAQADALRRLSAYGAACAPGSGDDANRVNIDSLYDRLMSCVDPQ